MKLKFAVRLRELRMEKHMTQGELGELFHVCKSSVYHWENSINEPSLQIILDLAEFFKVSTDYLLGVTDSD